MLSHTLLHLSLIPDLAPLVIKKLFEHVLEQGSDLYAFSVSDYGALGISEKVAQALVGGLAQQALLDRECARLERAKVQWTTLADTTYPALLWHTYAPPPVLYWQGQPVWNSGSVLSVVGSRAATNYGQRAVDTILAPCVDQGMIIVSGGAYGIDTMAHHLTLQRGGATVVVLGTGLLNPYPASNKQLFAQIAERGGAVVSCFSLESRGIPWQFPVRNRIIAGMARGTLVVQAAEGSGALITARYALNEGRNVYAVPGAFDDPLSFGCHQLLQDGAQLVTRPEAILEDYPGLQAPAVQMSLPVAPRTKAEISKKPAAPDTGLLALCARPISLEELIQETGTPEHELQAELFELQLAGKIEQDFVGLWSKVA